MDPTGQGWPTVGNLVDRARQQMVEQQRQQSVDIPREEALALPVHTPALPVDDAVREELMKTQYERLAESLRKNADLNQRMEVRQWRAAATIAESPLDFGYAMVGGVLTYCKGEIEGMLQVWVNTTLGLAAIEGCAVADALDLRERGQTSMGEQIFNVDICQPYDQTMDILKKLPSVAQGLAQISWVDMVRAALELKDVALEALITLLDIVGDEDEAVFGYIDSVIADAEALGKLAGTVVGAVLWEIATEGLGRVAKSAGLIDQAVDLASHAARVR
jgi:hypothetical protein